MRKLVPIAFTIVSVCMLAVLLLLLRGQNLGVFEPKGFIAGEERALMFHALLLMGIVVVPVFALAFAIAWRYRAGNKKAVYSPNWEHSRLEELIWWAVPFEIVLVLGALTWSSTHRLDPRVPIESVRAPLVIQVVALEWKWLFIYPEQNIATVNEFMFPAGKPVEFYITADAPMNSFWIPQLGGQIYAMTGMVTKLNLIADEPGVYAGGSANYSGEGFAQMQFKAKAVPQTEFDAWIEETARSPQALDSSTYDLLAKPGTMSPRAYAPVAQNFYNTIVEKFMSPTMQKMH